MEEAALAPGMLCIPGDQDRRAGKCGDFNPAINDDVLIVVFPLEVFSILSKGADVFCEAT